MFIWYPIDGNQRSPMKYIDYYLLSDLKDQQRDTIQEIHYGLLDSMLSAEIKDLKITGNNEDILARYKNLITISQKEAQISGNSFPLILFAPGGNTSAYMHSVICEFLASYGYIVVSIPSLGNSEGKRWPFDNIGLNIQIDDMSFAINHLANTMKEFNTEKICLISWSVGGVSQGIYCMKNSLIDMFISLDSGLGREYGVEMIKVSPYFDYSKIKIPFLHITGAHPEQYDVPRTSEFYDSIASTRKYSLILEPFAHQHFASQIGYIPSVVSEKRNQLIEESYINLCNITLIFIDAFLTEKSKSEEEWMELISIYK